MIASENGAVTPRLIIEIHTFRDMKFSCFAALTVLLSLPFYCAETPVKFREVYDLVHSNLTDISDAELDSLAAKGLIKELQPAVQLGGEPEQAEKQPSLPIKSAVYNDTFAFIRLTEIDSKSPAEFQNAFKALASSNRLRGLVLDLRYAAGQDYKAAAEVADRFLKKEEPLLKWGDTVVRSTAKTNAIDLPVAILVNGQTSGGAEALAALLREKEAGLLIGSKTAGRTRMFENFTLSTGQQLRIGKTPVELGGGQALPAKGLGPDILVSVESANERAWYEDPYKNISRVFGQTVSTNELASSSTNRVRTPRLMNEAELVRRHREGSEVEGDARTAADTGKPVITDPVLARGLDFLKGVSVLQQLRSL